MPIYEGDVEEPEIIKLPKRDFFKTTIVVEVLSENTPTNDMELNEVAYAIEHGDCVGRTAVTEVIALGGPETSRLLKEFGSDPGFFNLDENGATPDTEGLA